MKLLDKTLIIISLTLLGMILLMYVASQLILMGSYSSLENLDTVSEVNNSLITFNYDLSTIDAVTVDYAYWDDTYTFIDRANLTSDGDPYITSNFIDMTFQMQKLNLVAFLDENGTVRYIRAYDLENKSYVSPPVGFVDQIRPGSPLIRSQSNGSVHGLVMVEGRPVMVSTYPIKNSDGDAPTKGTLIMGRFLDQDEVGALDNIAGQSIAILPYADADLPADFGLAKASLNENHTIFVHPVNSSNVGGYSIIDDVDGHPAVILRVDKPRTIYEQGQNTMIYILLMLLLAGVVFSAVTFFLLDSMVVSPISHLGARVQKIGVREGEAIRMPAKGDDEVAVLADTIDRTMDALDQSRLKLYTSEQKFRGLVENISDVVWEADDRYVCTYISPNVREITGYDPSEVLGRPVFDLMEAEDTVQLRRKFAQISEKKSPISLVEVVIRSKRGERIFFEFSGTRIFDKEGRTTGYHGIARDIRERKQVELVLQKWADIFQLARIPIMISGPGEVGFDMVNPAFAQMYGYDAGDLDSMRFEDLFEERHRGDLSRHMGLADAEGHHVFDSRHVRKDGASFPVIVDVSVVKDSHDSVLYRVINVQDITERKHAEEALHQAYDELMRSNVALQAEISERKRVEEQIRASLREKEVLLKEIHHRVKNNLQIISSLLNLQSSNMSQESAAAFMESQSRIKSMALIHEKLYQSRDLSHIDFGEYAGNLTAYLARSYTCNPGVKISIDIRHISLGIDLAIPCGLIINELVSNSLKYAFKDGRPGEIRIRLTEDDGRYMMVVGDNGVGLPPGFDFRNSPSLGLQLVNTLVDQIEGTIEMENRGGVSYAIRFGRS